MNADEEERDIVECEEKEDREVVNEDGTLNLFSGVSPCVSVSNFRSFFIPPNLVFSLKFISYHS